MNPPTALNGLEGLTKFVPIEDPRIYFLCQGGEVVYVGQTV